MSERLLQAVSQASSDLPALWTVLYIVGLLLGAIVWTLGRSLVKPACAISGLVLGGLGGLAVGRALANEGAMVLPLVIGAGIGGALLAALLFRAWVAISGAILLALAVPALMLVWQGTLAPQPAATATQEAAATQPANQLQPMEFLPESQEQAREQLQEAVSAAGDKVSDWYSELVDRVKLWWQELPSTTRNLVYVAAGVGAVIGLILGLIMPYTAASVESALAGSLLMLLAGRALLDAHWPTGAGWLPQTPRGLLACLGLITVLGVFVQWTLFRRRADR